MSECGTFEEWISESLDRALPAARRSELDAHLATCAGCRLFRDEVAASDEELRGGTESEEAMSRVWRRLRPRKPLLRTLSKFAAMLLVGVVGYAAGRLQPSTPGPKVTQERPGEADPLLADLSAKLTVGLLCPGADDPEAVLRADMARLAERELLPMKR
ncbi:MAG: zf-HC2 domain-containing protein [Planctomycetes bacterium]|nr:zf-HC2 domain-containing protein [Planctomycetota bacterium]